LDEITEALEKFNNTSAQEMEIKLYEIAFEIGTLDDISKNEKIKFLEQLIMKQSKKGPTINMRKAIIQAGLNQGINENLNKPTLASNV